MGADFIDKLRQWADELSGSYGTYENRFVNEALVKYLVPVLTLLLVVVSYTMVILTVIDVFYIAVPGFRVILHKVIDKVQGANGNLSNGAAGYLATKSARVQAARKAEIDGVAAGLLYYLKTRICFFVVLGFIWGVFGMRDGLSKVVGSCGSWMQSVYVTYQTQQGVVVDYVGDEIKVINSDYVNTPTQVEDEDGTIRVEE